MVPEVAEVENLFCLEGVVKAMARRRGRNPEKVFGRVSAAVMDEFRRRFDEQALQHVRHRVKREVECRIDARFPLYHGDGAAYRQYGEYATSA